MLSLENKTKQLKNLMKPDALAGAGVHQAEHAGPIPPQPLGSLHHAECQPRI